MSAGPVLAEVADEEFEKNHKKMSRLVRKGLNSEHCEFDILFLGLIFVPKGGW